MGRSSTGDVDLPELASRHSRFTFSFVLDKAEPQSVHPVAGVTVDLAGSSRSTVSLLSVSRETTGGFRCEVSGAAPVFPTDTKYADLLVVEAPSSAGPLISGSRGRYDLGDTATINCSLASTWPAANLTWYINNKRVSLLSSSLLSPLLSYHF